MITVQHLTKVYNPGQENEVTALNDVSLEIRKNEFVVIIGSNGSGKTTLLNLIQGTERPTSGTITLHGNEVTRLPDFKRSRWIARVFQNPNQGTAPDLSILENFRLAALRTRPKFLKIGTSSTFKKKVHEKIASLEMGLENKLSRPMNDLSGGQRQALTLLMSVMDETDILLLDEPTAALDPKSASLVMNLAERLTKTLGITTLLITHNLKDAHQFGNRLLQFREGKIIHDMAAGEKAALSIQDIFHWFE